MRIPLKHQWRFLTSPAAFAAGFFYCMGSRMYKQDSLGLEGYIALVREHWIELPPIVGLAIMWAAAIAWWLLYRDERKVLEQYIRNKQKENVSSKNGAKK